jgi:hypothetical protein
MKNKETKISEEIYQKRKELRDLDRLFGELYTYFIKVEDKLKMKGSKMLMKIGYFIIGVLVGTIFGWKFLELALDYLKTLI